MDKCCPRYVENKNTTGIETEDKEDEGHKTKSTGREYEAQGRRRDHNIKSLAPVFSSLGD
jgi:hypothetical protein